MKKLFKKCFGWLGESDRPLHIIAGYLIGIIFGLIPVIIAALAVEFKDWMWNGHKGWPITKNSFDWLDVLATLIGGCIGVSVTLACTNDKVFSILTGMF